MRLALVLLLFMGQACAQLALPALTLAPCAETVEVSEFGSIRMTKSKKKKKKKTAAPSRTTAQRVLQIGVDALGDPIKSDIGSPSEPPRAASNVACSISTNDPKMPAPGGADGSCTLRAAIENANGLSGGEQRVVVLLRPGRFRLSGRLPDVTGNVELRGADLSQLPPPVKRNKAERKGWSKEEAARMADADDYKDRTFQPKRPGNHQLAPVTSTIDGGRRFQILRTGYGSSLRVSSVRFEFGVAMEESSDDPRDALGGALCASGNVTMNNSIVRSNRAVNGGGLYTEGYTKLRHSVLADNFADQCGGLIYAAGVASVLACEVVSNSCGHYDCKKLIKEKELKRQQLKAKKRRGKAPGGGGDEQILPSWRRREAKPTSGGFGDDDEDEDVDPTSRDADASGAVAEGPPLTGAPTVDKEEEDDDEFE